MVRGKGFCDTEQSQKLEQSVRKSLRRLARAVIVVVVVVIVVKSKIHQTDTVELSRKVNIIKNGKYSYSNNNNNITHKWSPEKVKIVMVMTMVSPVSKLTKQMAQSNHTRTTPQLAVRESTFISIFIPISISVNRFLNPDWPNDLTNSTDWPDLTWNAKDGNTPYDLHNGIEWGGGMPNQNMSCHAMHPLAYADKHISRQQGVKQILVKQGQRRQGKSRQRHHCSHHYYCYSYNT